MRRLKSHRIGSSEKGAASVEFALLAGLLFAIILSTIEFGVWSTYQTLVTGAARDGAIQFSMTGSANNSLKTVLLSSKGLNPSLAKAQVSLYVSNSIDTLDKNPISTDSLDITDRVCSAGQAIKVRVSYPRTILSSTNTLLNSSILPPIAAESVAICE